MLLFTKKSLRHVGLFNLGKRMLWGDLIATFQHFTGVLIIRRETEFSCGVIVVAEEIIV